jgi:hypothetical protein
MKSFRLGEPFEIWGQWWLPEKRDEVLAGRLRCYLGNLELMLLGQFSGLDINARGLVVDIIHGAGDAKAFTLWRAVQDQVSFSFPGTLKQSFHRMRILVGGHFPKESECLFTAVAFDAPQIGPWMGNEPVKQELLESDKKLRTRFEIAEHRRQDFGPCSNGVVYHFGSNVATRSEAFVTYGFETTPTAQIVFPEPVGTTTAVKRVENTAELLTLLVGQDVEPQAVRLFTAEEKGGFEFLYEFRPPVEEKLLNVREVLVPLPRITGSLVSVLDRWDQELPKMGDSVNLLTDVLDRASPQSHVQLLLLAQALEAFHRNVIGGEYLFVDDYEPIKKVLVDAIPTCVKPDHREALKSKIRYGNELSLRVRLRKLLDPFTDELLARISVDRKTFVNDVVDARNDYTHWVQEREKARPQGAHLANLLSSLRGMTQLILLCHLGVSEDLVVDRMLESPWLHLRRYQPIGKPEEATPPPP